LCSKTKIKTIFGHAQLLLCFVRNVETALICILLTIECPAPCPFGAPCARVIGNIYGVRTRLQEANFQPLVGCTGWLARLTRSSHTDTWRVQCHATLDASWSVVFPASPWSWWVSRAHGPSSAAGARWVGAEANPGAHRHGATVPLPPSCNRLLFPSRLRLRREPVS
jgi:hypothetical protein